MFACLPCSLPLTTIMINITDFFPTHTQRLATTQERAQLDTDAVGSSVLVLNLNLRYVIEYALNHLQKDNSSNSTLESPSNFKEATVLIVTDSQLSLQECMRQEQQICKELYEQTSSTHQGSQEEHEAVKDPWAHLWPPPRLPPPDEYITETPTSSQATISRSASATDHGPEQEGAEGKDPSSFRSYLWARIQIRYAPTIRHVMSLFRCLHLSPGSTHGKTFGPPSEADSVGEDHEAVVPSPPPASADNGAGVGGLTKYPAPPTLVILLGCFGRDRSLEIRRFSMLDIIPAFAGLRTFDEKEYMVDQSVADEAECEYEVVGRVSQGGGGGTERSCNTGGGGGSGRGYSEIGREIGRKEEQVETLERIDEEGEVEEEEEEELDNEELEELEYAEYIRMVINTMAEIKDSLAWLERSSGRKPELLIIENTGQHPTTPSQHCSSRTSPNTQNEMMPTVRELWLQTVMGYWVDSFIKIERPPIIQQGSVREAYRLWVRTQESLNAAFTAPAAATTMQMPAMSEHNIDDACSSSNTTTTATASAAASMGAVLGVQWHFDSASNRVHFKIIS